MRGQSIRPALLRKALSTRRSPLFFCRAEPSARACRSEILACARARGYVPAMTDDELHARMKAYAMGWKATGELLEKIRREDVRAADTQRSLEILGGMFDHAVLSLPPRADSGFFEQQRLFALGRG